MGSLSILPKKVVFPPRENWLKQLVNPDQDEYHRDFYQYFVNTAVYAGLEVVFDEDLKAISNQAIPFIVDDMKCAYDISDYSIVQPQAWSGEFKCYFMLHHLPVFDVYPNLGSIPQQSFFDWDEYNHLSESQYDCSSTMILHCQNLGHIARRNLARKLLADRFKLTTECWPISEFWKLGQKCCTSVHIPGSTPHILDRGQLQLMGMGVCTVSPNIYCSLGELRPEPNIHYVCIKDDFSNLIEKVDWCVTNPNLCIEIGDNAKKLFRDSCTPFAIWKYIKKRIAPPVAMFA